MSIKTAAPKQRKPKVLGIRHQLFKRLEFYRALGLSGSVGDRLRASGALPAPDVILNGRTPMWTRSTILRTVRAWVEQGRVSP
jgi:hypothetical protein